MPLARTDVSANALRVTLLAFSLASSGCGEPDLPSADDPGGGDAVPAPEQDAEGERVTTLPDDASTGTSASASLPSSEASATLPPGPSTAIPGEVPTGTPPSAPDEGAPDAVPGGEATVPPARPPASLVDCAATLPCRLVSTDGGIAATLTAADGEALDGSGPLRVDVVLEAVSRDAVVSIESSSSVVAGGQVLAADALGLGATNAPGARDEAAHALVAGVPINGHVTFGGSFLGNPLRLDRVMLHLSEAGTTRSATFVDVPLGPEASAPIDCADALPCRWTSADGDATLALTDAAPARWNRATRLVVSWSIAATRPLEIALTGPGRVTGAAGETLEPYGVELDGVESRDGTVLARALTAGESVVGRTVPRRVPEDGTTTLGRVEIAVVERRSPRTPRWRPVFLNVPLRTPLPEE